jgi:DNA-directed RNA polymerase specialized sigma subunit
MTFTKLMIKAKKGDEKAIAQIIERFEPLLRRHSFIGDASIAEIEDCYSTIVIKLIESIDRFDFNYKKRKNFKS